VNSLPLEYPSSAGFWAHFNIVTYLLTTRNTRVLIVQAANTHARRRLS